MDSRMLLFGIVSLAVVLTLGYVLGRWTAPDRGDGERSAGEEAADRARPASGAAAVATGGEDLAQEIARLEGDLALQKLRKETLEHELYGEPLAWPEEIPERYEPDWFQENFRQAVAACAPDVEIVGFDCSEPPCLVQLRGGDDGWWDRLINECPGWADLYGTRVGSASGSIECAGGGEERYRILGPGVAGWLDDDPEAKENRRKRWAQRTEEIRYHWVCAEGAPAGD